MYSWYFPKDSPSPGLGHRHDWEHVVVWIDNPDIATPTILAVTPSAHGGYEKYLLPRPEVIDGTAVKINYASHWPMNHELDITTDGGETQALIMWDQMTNEARNALNTAYFGAAYVPMTDGNFLPKLGKAWPW